MKKTHLQKILAIVALAMAGSAFSETFSIIESAKQEELKLNARIGIAVIDHESNKVIDYHGKEIFPINSTHKAFLCAAMLSKAEKGLNSLHDSITINKNDLVTYSPVVEKITSGKTTPEQMCKATLEYSDNTAANLVLSYLGGTNEFNTFMRSINDQVTRLDRMEPELNEATPGDSRDTTSPIAAAESLDKILLGTVLQPTSRNTLKNWMEQDRVADTLLRKVLPAGWRIADKTGAGGYGSRSIIAVVYPTNRKPLVIAIYITQTIATIQESNEAIAKIGSSIFVKIQHQNTISENRID